MIRYAYEIEMNDPKQTVIIENRSGGTTLKLNHAAMKAIVSQLDASELRDYLAVQNDLH